MGKGLRVEKHREKVSDYYHLEEMPYIYVPVNKFREHNIAFR